MQAALWPIERSLTISDHDNGEWAFFVTERSATDSTNEVPSITIKQILQKIAVDRIDLLKLDIEGSERELFSSAETWLDKVECIVVELHDRWRPGCAKAVYSALVTRDFIQETRGKNIFVRLDSHKTIVAS
jgi:hypothetical protein